MTYPAPVAFQSKAHLQVCSVGAAAGIAGGAAEVFWIVIYKQLSGGSGSDVARGVTETLFSDLFAPAAAVPLGVAIHMGIAILLGIAVSVFVRSLLPRSVRATFEMPLVIGLLTCVWATNFLVVLPAVNPAFVALVPYAPSLASKLLFGLAAAFVFKHFDGRNPADSRT